jgi:hypothetical protein
MKPSINWDKFHITTSKLKTQKIKTQFKRLDANYIFYKHGEIHLIKPLWARFSHISHMAYENFAHLKNPCARTLCGVKTNNNQIIKQWK